MRKLFKAHEYLDKHIYKELKVRDDTQEGLWRCECGAMLWRTGDDKLERLGKAWRESNVIEWDKEWKDPVVLKALMIDDFPALGRPTTAKRGRSSNSSSEKSGVK